jgi:putative membrane protein
VAAVLLLGAAAVAHATARHGARGGLVVLVVGAGIGLVAEVTGVHTGFPFGRYSYAGTLGPAVAGVPVVVPLAWVMLGYPCLLLGRTLAAAAAAGPAGRRRPVTALVTALAGGWTLAAWDLYLDPQMGAAGHWVWSRPEPALPGVPGIPLTNYAGWLLVAVILVAALDRTLPDDPARAQGPPAVVLIWTWLGSALGNLVLFDRPAVAGWGLLGMGVGVLPYLVVLARGRVGRSGVLQPAGAGR